MKKYEAPSLEVTKLNVEDVIASTYTDYEGGSGDLGGFLNTWSSSIG